MARWIEVGKSECRECHGSGVDASGRDLLAWGRSVRDLKRNGHECRACNGTGEKSVGYMHAPDASGR